MNITLVSGRLEDHPFAELAGLVFRESLSGELVLDTGERRRSVWFLGGNPVAVVSGDPEDHLARFLLEQGKIGAEDAHLLAKMPETREELGKAEFLPKETLTWGVKYRFVNLCYDLFRWDAGDYSFTEGDPPRQLFLLKVPAHALIFKGVGFVGQATIIEAVADDAACAAGTADPAEARYLSPDLRALLDDCLPGRAVGDVLAGRGEEVLPTRRLLYALSCLGLVVFSPPAAAAGAAPPPAGAKRDRDLPEGPPGVSPPESPDTFQPQPDAGEPAFAHDFPRQALPEATPVAPGGGGEPFGTPGLPPQPERRPFQLERGGESFGAPETPSAREHRDEPPSWPEGTPPDGPTSAPEASSRSTRLSRVSGVALGTLAAAGLLAGAWWWMNSAEPPPPPIQPPARPAATTPPPQALPQAPPPVATGPAKPPEAGAPPAPAPPPPPPPASAPVSSKAPPLPAAPTPRVSPPPAAPSKQTAPQTPPKAAPPSLTPSTHRSAETRGNERYLTALSVFKAGDLDGAAAMWETQLAEQRDAYTLLLLTACSGETVLKAQRALAPQQLYLIAKRLGGRDCYRVCLGTYGSREEAGRALAGLPEPYRSEGAAVRSVANALGTGR